MYKLWIFMFLSSLVVMMMIVGLDKAGIIFEVRYVGYKLIAGLAMLALPISILGIASRKKF